MSMLFYSKRLNTYSKVINHRAFFFKFKKERKRDFLTSSQEKANCLNDYFACIMKVDNQNSILPNCQLKTLNKLVITILVIKDAIHSININKASGPDGTSHTMLNPFPHNDTF